MNINKQIRHLFLSKRAEFQRKGNVAEDRVELEEKLCWAKRMGEGTQELALTHPLRPLFVYSKKAQRILVQEGFHHVDGAGVVMLPPEGMSRRKAKKLRDKVVQELKKNRKPKKKLFPYERVEEELRLAYEEELKFSFEDLLKQD